MVVDDPGRRVRGCFVLGCAAGVLGLFVAGVAWSAWHSLQAERQSADVARELRTGFEAGLADGSVSVARFRAMRIAQIMGEYRDDGWLPRPPGVHLESYGMSNADDRAELRYRGTSRAGGYCFDVSFGDQPVVSVRVVERC